MVDNVNISINKEGLQTFFSYLCNKDYKQYPDLEISDALCDKNTNLCL